MKSNNNITPSKNLKHFIKQVSDFNLCTKYRKYFVSCIWSIIVKYYTNNWMKYKFAFIQQVRNVTIVTEDEEKPNRGCKG